MFEGIGPRAARLIVELAHRQDKAWYTAHKPELDREAFAPLRALLEEAVPRLKRLYPGQQLTAKVFRIHRDVRFARDKSPYKDHASGVILVGAELEPGNGTAALYLQVGPDEGAAAGRWSMDREALARHRAAVQDERQGAALEKLLRPLLAGGFSLTSAGQLSRAPRGVDPAHPRLALLKHQGLAVDFPAIPRKLRSSPGLLDWCVERATEVAPLVRWLLRHT